MAPDPLFARYAYPPNALGYCGPADPKDLVAASSPNGTPAGLAGVARRFTGAWPYLELIAGASGIADPMDSRVVEAYWVGSGLLDEVPASSLLDCLREHPDARLGDRSPIHKAVMAGGVAHHSFHVFAVYPWLALLRAGKPEPALTVLDRCRIRCGRVERADGPAVAVWSQPLELDGRDLVLGEERLDAARCRSDDVGYVEDLVPGDFVSLHWDWVCDRLDPAGLEHLQHFTARSLRAVNVT